MIKQINKAYIHYLAFIGLLFFLFLGNVHSQTSNSDSLFKAKEHSIRELMMQIYQSKVSDRIIDSMNRELISEVSATLSMENSMDYPFDSVQPVTKIVSEDKQVRLFTWNVNHSDGSSKYYGFIQYWNKNEKLALLFKLNDSVPAVESIEKTTLSPKLWYGAIYYQIIETKMGSDKLYTLLGWCSRDVYLNKKVIETLTFNDNNQPVFGTPVFDTGKLKFKRIVFTYARRATMLLSYDPQLKMIVMDHLSPVTPIYENNYSYYGPDLSYDGFEFKNDLWIFKPTIDYKPQPEKRIFRKKTQ